MDVRKKALLMGALFLIVSLFFFLQQTDELKLIIFQLRILCFSKRSRRTTEFSIIYTKLTPAVFS